MQTIYGNNLKDLPDLPFKMHDLFGPFGVW